MLKRITKPLAVLGVTVLALAAAVTVAAVMAQGDSEPKFPLNPWTGKSDAERQADVDTAHKRNEDYLRDFVASGKDLRALPVIEIEAYAAPLPDLPSAVGAADVVLRGVVETTTFESSPTGGLPIMLSSVRVAAVEKGTPTADVITVRQLGGPVAQKDGGAFARLHNDEPILPGDEVILFLQRGDGSQFTTQPGTGVYFVRDEQLYAEEANPFSNELSGRSADWLQAAVRAASP